MYVLKVAYDGSRYFGFQRQPGVTTVQGELERALGLVFNEKISLTAAGRTDKGVHGLGQVVSFNSSVVRPLRAVVEGANDALGPSAAVLLASRLGEGGEKFHPRYSARQRTYSYYLLRVEDPTESLLWRERAWCLGAALDLDKMSAAGRLMVGEHDFSTFSFRCPRDNVREVFSLEVERLDSGCLTGAELYRIRVSATGFLRKMVRLIVAGLVEVGLGLRELESLATKLRACDPGQAPHPAPPHGLYFESAQYDPDPFEPGIGPVLEVYRGRPKLGLRFKA